MDEAAKSLAVQKLADALQAAVLIAGSLAHDLSDTQWSSELTALHRAVDAAVVAAHDLRRWAQKE